MKQIAWCWASVTLAVPGIAAAQDASPTNDIIVEARKRPESADDVPASIQVVSAAVIARDHVRSIDELGERLPDVVLNRRQDNEPNAVIRGVGAFGNVQGIGFYLDDVQNFTDQTAAIADVERIEVLRGPQGTLYGGSSIGGAIKYVLKRPGDHLDTEGSLSYGSFNTLEAFAAANVPITEGLAVRISGFARRTDGYVANTTLGGHADRAHEDGGRVALAWSPNADVSVLVQLRHNVLDDGGNIYVRVPDAVTFRRDVAYNEHAYNDRTVTGGSIAGDFNLGDAKLTLVSSYARRSNRFLWDLDYSAADAVTLTNGDRHTTRVVTEEARLTSTADRPVTWLAGAYYSEVIDRPLTIDTDVLLGRAAGGPRLIRDYSDGGTDERQYALFGTLGYNPGRWRFEVGARLNRAEFDGTVFGVPVTRTSVDTTLLLPRASIGYDVGAALFYASITAGAEPGKVNVQSLAGSAYLPEQATSTEIGAKGAIAGGRAHYALAIFLTDDRRRQLETLFANAAGVLSEELTNIGRSVSYGAEASLDARLGHRLTLSLASAWLRARWADRNARFDLMPIDGLRIPNAPAATASIGASYRQPLGSALVARLSVDSRVTSRFAWDVPNTAFQSSYAIVNATAAIEQRSSDRWSLSVRVANLTNATYFTEFYPDLFGPRQSLGAPGRPRAVIATLALHS